MTKDFEGQLIVGRNIGRLISKAFTDNGLVAGRFDATRQESLWVNHVQWEYVERNGPVTMRVLGEVNDILDLHFYDDMVMTKGAWIVFDTEGDADE